jgi:hypothetical protein
MYTEAGIAALDETSDEKHRTDDDRNRAGMITAGATLAVIDSVTEAMSLLGLNPYDSTETAEFFAQLPRPLAEGGAAVVLLDHVVKDRDNRGRWAIGAQHKMAGSDVCFSLEAIRPFGRGLTGGCLGSRSPRTGLGSCGSAPSAGHASVTCTWIPMVSR